jgi:arylsulfatase A-like enzyme
MLRYRFLTLLCCAVNLLLPAISARDVPASASPNVLFISIDDLNDWIGVLDGHPQVQTPNIDRLAQRGVLFTNAHCAAPACNPSRAAVFSGLYPFETGVLSNNSPKVDKLHPDLVLLPEHFQQNGYRTFGTGKLLHSKSPGLFDEEFWPEQRWSPFTPEEATYTADEQSSKGTANPRHVTQLKGETIILPLNRMPSDRYPERPQGESFDWGPLDVLDSDMGDGQSAIWGAQQLAAAHEKPFFLGTGFYRPHIPLFAPQKYFDLYADLEIQLPPTLANDLDDLSPIAKKWALEAVTAGSHASVIKHGQWTEAVKAYLASVSFVDAQVGILLDALDSGPNANNTTIVLWSDHGWQLGEKEHWGKWTGWQRSTRVPLIIVPPRNAPPGTYSTGTTHDHPVNLLDLYPTLLELSGLPARASLSGRSLVPVLRQPSTPTARTVLTTFDQDNYAITTTGWRYLRYADNTEELYDSFNDPHEWINLAGLPEHAAKLAELRAQLTRLAPPPQIQIAAHRGGYENDQTDGAPENSVENIRNAARQNYAFYETDIQRTKDGHFVIVHDPTIDRETTGTGRADQHTLAELKQLHKRYRDRTVSTARVATLAEFLEAGKKRTIFKADLKPGMSGHFPEIIQLVTKLDARDAIVFRVPYAEADLFDRYRREGVSYHQNLLMFKVSTRAQVDAIKARFDPLWIQINVKKSAPSDPATLDLIRYATQQGLHVEAHAEGTPKDWARLANAGVRLFHTNTPRAFQAFLQSSM